MYMTGIIWTEKINIAIYHRQEFIRDMTEVLHWHYIYVFNYAACQTEVVLQNEQFLILLVL